MRILYTIISSLLLGAFIYFGHYGEVASLPPIVKFFNPYDGWWQQAESKKLPRRYFEAPVSNDITIAFDERWVPHIYAETFNDALYAQGILHAYFRLWQMDITHRGSVGRVSEILGSQALNYDREKRRMGMNSAAHNIAKALKENPDLNPLVSSYINGVNTIISALPKKDYPIEYKLLNYEPELWTHYHLSGIIMAMTFDLCYKHNDPASTLSYQFLDSQSYNTYFPGWNPKQVPIVQKGVESKGDSINFKNIPILQIEGKHPTLTMPEEGIGSNNWAIHQSKTKSGNNILANDPHLRLSLPSVWYEMHIHLPERDIYGVSFPGIPGIILGFTNQYAWGSTNVSHDVADWYKLIWRDSTYTEYYFEGEWKAASHSTEKIAVKNADSVFLTIPETELGRVPYTQSDSLLAGCAFQWTPLLDQEGGGMKTFLGFNLGLDYNGFKDALVHYDYPAQNFAFADKADNIAIHVQGKLPIRSQGKGIFVLDSIQEKQWMDFIPQKELPFEHNPERGHVSSSNQHSTYPSYPYEYHGFFDDYRGRTIDSFLGAHNNIDIEKVREFQLSTFSLEAKEVLPVLLSNLRTADEHIRHAIDLLANWNYHYEAGEQAPVIFDMWWNEVLQMTMDEFGSGAYSAPESWVILELIRTSPRDPLFDKQDTEVKEDAQLIIQKALENVVTEHKQAGQPNWADYKQTEVRHIADIEAFSSGIIKNGGSKNALNAMQKTKGPSWRMIVELGEEIEARGVYPGGQSGNPGSRYYDNQITDWAEGNYYPLEMIQSPDDKRLIRKWNIKKKR